MHGWRVVELVWEMEEVYEKEIHGMNDDRKESRKTYELEISNSKSFGFSQTSN